MSVGSSSSFPLVIVCPRCRNSVHFDTLQQKHMGVCRSIERSPACWQCFESYNTWGRLWEAIVFRRMWYIATKLRHLSPEKCPLVTLPREVAGLIAQWLMDEVEPHRVKDK